MPGKGKGKARGKSRGKGERLQRKIKYRVSEAYLKRTGQTPAEARIAMLEFFELTGDQLPGTQIVVSWRNPDNKNLNHANWKSSETSGQSLAGAFATLHGSMIRALETSDDELKITKRRKK
jgi:hypothetical protein